MDKLQKNELTEIQKKLPLPIKDCIGIAYQTVKGEIKTPEDISTLYNIPLESALLLLTNHVFSTLVHNMMLAVQKQRFDAVAVQRMMNIAEFGEDKDAISAVKVAGDMLGLNKSKDKTPVTVELNLDSLIRRLEPSFPGL